MPASFLHVLPGLVGAWGEIWHGGALELSAFDRLAATARRPGGQKLCRSAIRRSERAGGGPPQARSAQCLQARRRWGAQSDIEKRDDDTRRYETIQVRRLNDFRPTAGKRRGAPPRPSCETTASTPAAAREAPKFSSALRAVAVVAVVECRYTYVAAQLSCRKKVHVARKNAAGRLESARRCVSKDVALQVWGRIRHTGRFRA